MTILVTWQLWVTVDSIRIPVNKVTKICWIGNLGNLKIHLSGVSNDQGGKYATRSINTCKPQSFHSPQRMQRKDVFFSSVSFSQSQRRKGWHAPIAAKNISEHFGRLKKNWGSKRVWMRQRYNVERDGWIIRRNQILPWICKCWFGVTKGLSLQKSAGK